jgi:hypothetical protein
MIVHCVHIIIDCLPLSCHYVPLQLVCLRATHCASFTAFTLCSSLRSYSIVSTLYCHAYSLRSLAIVYLATLDTRMSIRCAHILLLVSRSAMSLRSYSVFAALILRLVSLRSTTLLVHSLRLFTMFVRLLHSLCSCRCAYINHFAALVRTVFARHVAALMISLTLSLRSLSRCYVAALMQLD